MSTALAARFRADLYQETERSREPQPAWLLATDERCMYRPSAFRVFAVRLRGAVLGKVEAIPPAV